MLTGVRVGLVEILLGQFEFFQFQITPSEAHLAHKRQFMIKGEFFRLGVIGHRRQKIFQIIRGLAHVKIGLSLMGRLRIAPDIILEIPDAVFILLPLERYFADLEMGLFRQLMRRKFLDEFHEHFLRFLQLVLLKIDPTKRIVRLRCINGIHVQLDQLTILLLGLGVIAAFKVRFSQPK